MVHIKIRHFFITANVAFSHSHGLYFLTNIFFFRLDQSHLSVMIMMRQQEVQVWEKGGFNVPWCKFSVGNDRNLQAVNNQSALDNNRDTVTPLRSGSGCCNLIAFIGLITTTTTTKRHEAERTLYSEE
jgi:hypothetical protein